MQNQLGMQEQLMALRQVGEKRAERLASRLSYEAESLRLALIKLSEDDDFEDEVRELDHVGDELVDDLVRLGQVLGSMAGEAVDDFYEAREVVDR